MDLNKEYEKLYQHWLKEFQQPELTECSQDTFNEYVKYIQSAIDHNEENINDLKNCLYQTYRDNVKFLFNDFLKIRELKIRNSALALKDINLDNLTEAEKLLYNNLVSSIKGYKKVKKLAIFEGGEIPSTLQEQKQSLELDSLESQPSTIKQAPEINETIVSTKQIKIDYVLVRFLKKTPSLVGIDLRNYGPFEEEDIANLPYKNAKILIFENFAEKIEID
jgi:DNA replication initiation complex subunit (GINS family)